MKPNVMINTNKGPVIPTGRKFTKLTCQHCDFIMVFDKRKREHKLPKMLKHIKETHFGK